LKLNRICLNELLNGSNKITTNSLSPAGPHATVSDLALAASKVQMEDQLFPTAIGHDNDILPAL